MLKIFDLFAYKSIWIFDKIFWITLEINSIKYAFFASMYVDIYNCFLFSINIMTTQLYYDEITSLEKFLYELEYECHSLDDSNQWIKMIYCHLANETLEWANNDEKMIKIRYYAYYDDVIIDDANRLNQLLENRFVASLSYKVSILMRVKQEHHESIENYFVRVNTIFRHVENQDKVIDQYSNLDHEHSCCFNDIIYWFVDDLKNVKLRRNMIDTLQNMSVENKSIINFESICIATQLKRIMIKRIRKFRNQLFDININIVIDMSQSSLKKTTCDLSKINTSIYSSAHISKQWFTQKWRARSLFEICIVDEFSSVVKQIRSEISKIDAVIVNIDIESNDEIFAFEFRKWSASTTTLFEIIVIYESSSVLEKMSCNLSETNTVIVNSSDIESIDERVVSKQYTFRFFTIHISHFHLIFTY